MRSSLRKSRGAIVIGCAWVVTVIGLSWTLASGRSEPFMVSISLCIWLVCLRVIVRHQSGWGFLSPAFVWFLFYSTMIFLGGQYLILTNGAYPFIPAERQGNLQFFLVINVSLLCVTLGILSASHVLHFSGRAEEQRFLQQQTPHSDVQFLPIATLAVIALGVTVFYFLQRGFIPLIDVLRFSQIGDVREEVRLASRLRIEFIHPMYAATFYQFYGNILPFCTLIAYAYQRQVKSRLSGLLFVALFAVTSFALLASLDRAPIALFLVSVALLSYVLDRPRMRRRIAIRRMVYVLLLFVLVSILRLGISGGDFGRIQRRVIDRIFITQSAVLYTVCELYPFRYPYAGGEILASDLERLKFGEKRTVSFSAFLSDQIFHLSAEAYGVHTAPTASFAPFYADFGFPGLIIYCFFLGLCLQAFYLWFLRGKRGLLRMVYFVSMEIALARLSFAFLFGAILQFGMLTYTLAYGFLTLANRIRGRVAPKSRLSWHSLPGTL